MYKIQLFKKNRSRFQSKANDDYKAALLALAGESQSDSGDDILSSMWIETMMPIYELN